MEKSKVKQNETQITIKLLLVRISVAMLATTGQLTLHVCASLKHAPDIFYRH